MADGYVTFRAKYKEPASFYYGIDAGANLLATIDASE